VKDEADGGGSGKRPDSDEVEREPSSSGINRRRNDRFDVTWQVDCETEDTFLYAYITNISEMGIFVKTEQPLAVGSALVLRFAPHNSDAPFVLRGIVQWVNPVRAFGDNPNPGMGIRFESLTLDDRERIVEAVRTIAYVRQSEKN
jgi:type IV pilus assembly protein PilZ